jgi:mevalonate kinase
MPPSRRVVASAPGKLILMGEHAVVYGHPALVSAIDRRLQVTLEPGEKGVLVRLPCLDQARTYSWPQVLEETRRAREEWEDRFVRRTRRQGPRRIEPGHLAVLALGEAALHFVHLPRQAVVLTVTSELPVGAGFGSSAALAAAVAGAWLAWHGELDRREALESICFEVERRQHGTPSGVDHTAVLEGGILEARRTPEGVLERRRLSPSPLLGRLQVHDSGRPRETTGQVVAAVARRLAGGDGVAQRALREIDCATGVFRHELSRVGEEDAGALLGAMRSCQRALEALGVVPEAVRAGIRRVERAGGAAKISGAGSLTGDAAGSILVYYPQKAAGEIAVLPPSWRRLALSLASPGLEVSRTEPGEPPGRQSREATR